MKHIITIRTKNGFDKEIIVDSSKESIKNAIDHLLAHYKKSTIVSIRFDKAGIN